MRSPRNLTDITATALRAPLTHHHGPALWGPPSYTNWIDESMSWKETAYLGDWSWLTTARFRGPDALRLFSDISVNNMEKFDIGQSKHVLHCNDDGKIIEEGVLTRTGPEELIAHSTLWATYVAEHDGYDVEVDRPDMTKYHLQGPNALHILERAAGQAVRDVRFMREAPVTIAGHPVAALRQGMSGEIGFELQTDGAHGEEVWNAIVEAGADFGLQLMGSRVAMLNHLEANYPTNALDYLPAIFTGRAEPFLREWIAEDPTFFDHYYALSGSFDSDDVTDWYRSPVELGWANRISFGHDFTGRDALRAEVDQPRRTIRTLVWNAEDIVAMFSELFVRGERLPDFMEFPQEPRGSMCADRVLCGGSDVGVSTSRGYSAYFREMISLAVLDVDQAEIGTELTVLWGDPGTSQREIRAVVRPAPYKEDRGRVDFATLPATPATGGI